MLRLLRTAVAGPDASPAREAAGRVDALAALAREAAAGHGAATRTLLSAVGPPMLQVIRKILGSANREVEDVLQEAMVGFLKALSGFRGECTVKHFACRVAVMSALGARRRLATLPGGPSEVSMDVAEAVPSDAPDPRREVEAAARRQLLLRLLEDLPGSQAEALALHCIEGLTLEEIAAATGCPRDTIKSRLRLGKAALRARIAEDDAARDLLEETP